MRSPVRPSPKLDLPAHPRFKGFEAFAAREIFPWLAAKDAERRGVLRRAKLTATATALIVVTLLLLAYFEVIGVFALIALGIVVTLLGAFATGWPVLSFESSIDEFLLTKTCEHLRLRYTASEPNLPIDRFLAARLLPPHDRLKLEDGIECEGPRPVFTAAEAILTESRTDSEGKSEEETVWRGLLLQVPAQRRFAGLTLVAPELGVARRFCDEHGAECIELGFGELEEGLEIRTTHSAEARAILTKRVMRRLRDLARRFGREWPTLGLIEDSALLAIESNRDRFRGGSVFKPLDRAETLEKLLADVAIVLELAEALQEALAPRTGSAESV